jgi:hypothetical protein
VKEMGRTKPKTVSELMDVANKFADGEDAYHNKRTRSPEGDNPSSIATREEGLETMTTIGFLAG